MCVLMLCEIQTHAKYLFVRHIRRCCHMSTMVALPLWPHSLAAAATMKACFVCAASNSSLTSRNDEAAV